MSIPLPETGFLRIKQIIGDRKAEIPPLIPVAESKWWKGVSEGRFPQPIRLSKGCTVWRVEDIYALIDNPPCAPVAQNPPPVMQSNDLKLGTESPIEHEQRKRRGATEKAGSSQRACDGHSASSSGTRKSARRNGGSVRWENWNTAGWQNRHDEELAARYGQKRESITKTNGGGGMKPISHYFGYQIPDNGQLWWHYVKQGILPKPDSPPDFYRDETISALTERAGVLRTYPIINCLDINLYH